MIRLFFYVEGQTEQGYVSKVLTPHLASFGVYVEGPIRAPDGSYMRMRRDLGHLLKMHSQPDVRFTTMFDLYALRRPWPGWDEAEKLRHIPRDRVRKLEEAFADDISDARLIPHIQLYEFETILLCGPEEFPLIYEKCDAAVKQLQEMVEKEGPPEQINDNPNTAPSKRIDKLFPGYAAAKTSDGVELASCVGLAKVRQMCPHFGEWLGRLEGLDQPSSANAISGDTAK
jgi:hypothetical protein